MKKSNFNKKMLSVNNMTNSINNSFTNNISITNLGNNI